MAEIVYSDIFGDQICIRLDEESLILLPFDGNPVLYRGNNEDLIRRVVDTEERIEEKPLGELFSEVEIEEFEEIRKEEEEEFKEGIELNGPDNENSSQENS